MEGERSKCLIRLLKLGGLWLNFSDYRLGSYITCLQLLRLLYLLFGVVYLFNDLFTKGISFLLTPSAVFMPLGTCVIVTSVIYLFEIKNLEILIATGEASLSSYDKPWEREIIQDDSNTVQRFSNLFKYSVSLFALVYMILPVLIDAVRACLGYSEPYLVPSPFNSYLEEIKCRNFKFYLGVLAADLWFSIGISNTIAFQCTLFYGISYATTQIKIVKEHIRRLAFDENGEILPNTGDWKLRNILKKHQQIIRLYGIQRTCITLPYVIQGLVSTFSITFIMYLIDQLIGNDNLVMILAIIFIVIMLVIMFIMCYAGEYLEKQGNEMFYTICNLPWYRQTPEARKDLVLLTMESARPLLLDYNRSSSLSYRAFLQMVNSAFSYFMLMKSFSQA